MVETQNESPWFCETPQNNPTRSLEEKLQELGKLEKEIFPKSQGEVGNQLEDSEIDGRYAQEIEKAKNVQQKIQVVENLIEFYKRFQMFDAEIQTASGEYKKELIESKKLYESLIKQYPNQKEAIEWFIQRHKNITENRKNFINSENTKVLDIFELNAQKTLNQNLKELANNIKDIQAETNIIDKEGFMNDFIKNGFYADYSEKGNSLGEKLKNIYSLEIFQSFVWNEDRPDDDTKDWVFNSIFLKISVQKLQELNQKFTKAHTGEEIKKFFSWIQNDPELQSFSKDIEKIPLIWNKSIQVLKENINTQGEDVLTLLNKDLSNQNHSLAIGDALDKEFSEVNNIENKEAQIAFGMLFRQIENNKDSRETLIQNFNEGVLPSLLPKLSLQDLDTIDTFSTIYLFETEEWATGEKIFENFYKPLALAKKNLQNNYQKETWNILKQIETWLQKNPNDKYLLQLQSEIIFIAKKENNLDYLKGNTQKSEDKISPEVSIEKAQKYLATKWYLESAPLPENKPQEKPSQKPETKINQEQSQRLQNLWIQKNFFEPTKNTAEGENKSQKIWDNGTLEVGINGNIIFTNGLGYRFEFQNDSGGINNMLEKAETMNYLDTIGLGYFKDQFKTIVDMMKIYRPELAGMSIDEKSGNFLDKIELEKVLTLFQKMGIIEHFDVNELNPEKVSFSKMDYKFSQLNQDGTFFFDKSKWLQLPRLKEMLLSL